MYIMGNPEPLVSLAACQWGRNAEYLDEPRVTRGDAANSTHAARGGESEASPGSEVTGLHTATCCLDYCFERSIY